MQPTSGIWVEAEGRLLAVKEVATRHFRLDILVPEVAVRARPGQFAMVRCGESLYPFLRRPLSFFDIDRGRGQVSFLVQVRGEGTAALVRRPPGQSVSMLAPLGNGFSLAAGRGVSPLLLVAGGVGVAPFPPAARVAREQGAEVVALVGARRAADVVGVDELGQTGARVKVATEDGSTGIRGLVTDLLVDYLKGKGPVGMLLACGPLPMLARVKEIVAGRGFPAYVSLEQRMACGFGTCRGCAIPATGGGYRHVCQDGPVFPVEDVEL